MAVVLMVGVEGPPAQLTRRRVEPTLDLMTMEGQPAPPLDLTRRLSGHPTSPESLSGKVVILFFWAHSCEDCKAQSSILAVLVDRYRKAGLTIVAPTRLYGYTPNQPKAPPEAELRYIIETRNRYYPFLRRRLVPLSPANHRRFGISSTPTLVILDRDRVVRFYRSGKLTIEQIEAAVIPLLSPNVRFEHPDLGFVGYSAREIRTVSHDRR